MDGVLSLHYHLECIFTTLQDGERKDKGDKVTGMKKKSVMSEDETERREKKRTRKRENGIEARVRGERERERGVGVGVGV